MITCRSPGDGRANPVRPYSGRNCYARRPRGCDCSKVPRRRRRWQKSSRRHPGHSYRPPRCAGTPSIICTLLSTPDFGPCDVRIERALVRTRDCVCRLCIVKSGCATCHRFIRVTTLTPCSRVSEQKREGHRVPVGRLARYACGAGAQPVPPQGAASLDDARTHYHVRTGQRARDMRSEDMRRPQYRPF